MFSARWQIDAKFGHKQTVLDLLKKWEREIGSQVGLAELKFQIMTGSIGAREATVESHHQVESLAQLEAMFAKIGKIDAHAKWGKEIGALCRVGHQPVEHLSHRRVAMRDGLTSPCLRERSDCPHMSFTNRLAIRVGVSRRQAGTPLNSTLRADPPPEALPGHARPSEQGKDGQCYACATMTWRTAV